MAYYQEIECWKYYDKDAYKISDDNRTITKVREKLCEPCYGSTNVPYDSIGVHHWKIEITFLQYMACIIGIDEASHQWIDQGYIGADKSIEKYVYIINAAGGMKRGPDGESSDCGESYKTGDIVDIILNMKDKTLLFGSNKFKVKKAFHIKRTAIGYSLVAFMTRINDKLTLQSYDYRRDL